MKALLIVDAHTKLELRRELVASGDRSGDVQLVVQLDTPRFRASHEPAWIARAARDRFLTALCALERLRRGEACLEAMSPSDLSLCVTVYDKAGHVVVRGHVGGAIVERDSVDVARVPLRIEVEPSALPALVRDMTRLLDTEP